jgi:hypothetical protein
MLRFNPGISGSKTLQTVPFAAFRSWSQPAKSVFVQGRLNRAFRLSPKSCSGSSLPSNAVLYGFLVMES